MNALKPLTTVGPSHETVGRPAVQSRHSAASPNRLQAVMASDTFRGTKFGGGMGAAIAVPFGLATLITSGLPGVMAHLPGKLLVVAGIAATSTVVFGAAGAVASRAKTQHGAALSAAAVGCAVAAIATGIATRNVAQTLFGAFAGMMVAGIVGNGVGETLKRPE